MAIGYTEIGNGKEKVLVLHGWFGDYGVWEPTFTLLDKNKFTYVFMDCRGYGKSKELMGDYTMKEIASDGISLMNELGYQDFHMVGHSMGGMAMQRIILDIDNPGRIKSCVGIDPIPACGGQLDLEAWSLFEGAIESDDNRYKILDFTTGNRNTLQWLDNMVENSHTTTTKPAYAGYLNAWAKEDFSDETKGLSTPTLVCIGEHDLAFTIDAMKNTYLAWLPNSQLEIIPNAGHYPMQETPVNLVTDMEGFMKKHM